MIRRALHIIAVCAPLALPLSAAGYYQPYYQPYYQNYYQGYYQAAYSTSNSKLNPMGDYTIDLWIYPTSVSTNGGILSRDTPSGYSPYLIYQSGSSILFYSSATAGKWDIAAGLTICSGISANAWYHVAVVRSGVNYSLFCNGTRTTLFSSALQPWRAPYNLVLGRQYTGGAYYQGYIDEVRFSDSARWTGTTFTPPTSAYTTDANTVMLLHMDDTLDSFYDSASKGYFAYTPPAGFKSLAAANLPAPSSDRPSDFFNVFTYTGNGSSQTVSTTFSPDLVWIKNRAANYWHTISDTVRGPNNDLFSNSDSAATQSDSNGWLSSFTGSSFTVGGQCAATPPLTDLNGNNYISWSWKKSQIAGIDVVSYTGDGATTRSITHSLGNVPDFLIIKRSDQSGDWYAWSSALTTPAHFLKLNTADAETSVNSPYSFDLIPTMAAATTNGVTMSGSIEYSSNYAWRAGDKSTGTYWSSYNGAAGYPNSGNPQWLRVDFGSSPQTVGSYTIRNYASSAYAPVSFTFQGSNDATSCTGAGSVWTTLDTQEWAAWRSYNSGQYQTFSVPSESRGSYRCYRIRVTRTSTNNEAIITELSLWPSSSLPSASNFSVQNNAANNLNVAGGEYVAYLFTNREGFQKTGSYVGNGSSDGPVIYTGFKPKFVMIKILDGSNSYTNWTIIDSARDAATPYYRTVHPNLANVENGGGTCNGSSNCNVDFLSNGFKLRNGNWEINNSQYRYAYIAFADVPFKSANTGNAYSISNALKFDTSNNEYLAKVFDKPATNLKKMTFSFWVKRSEVGTSRSTIVGSAGNQEMITFENDRLMARFANQEVQSAEVFRDTTKWYHIVVSFDTTQSAGGLPRTRMYVDGKEVLTYNTAAYPAQNTNAMSWSVSGQTANIGRDIANNGYRFDGYLADFNFVDGQALAPTWFGAYDGSGYWKPKAYTDVYGNNGFHLTFTETADVGQDASGKANHWSAGTKATFDQVIDTPTNNFTTLSPNNYYSPHYGDGTIRAGGLAATAGYGAAANWQLTSGKWYWEFVVGGVNPGYPYVGVFSDPMSGWAYRAFPGHDNDNGFGYGSGGYIVNNSFTTPNFASSFVNGDVIGVAYDADTGRTYFSKNGQWLDGVFNSPNKIPAMTAATTGGLTISASTEYSTNYAWRVGDKVRDGNYWYTYSHVPSVSSPDWIRFDFGAGNSKTLASYSMQNYYNGLGYDPINFTFEGSNDASTCSSSGSAWTVLDTRSDVIWSSSRETQYFNIPSANQAAYRCYRLKVTGAGTPASPNYYLIIEEMGLYEAKPNPANGTGYAGVVKGGTPGLSSYYGKTYVNFGAGGTPGTLFSDSSSYGRALVEVGSPQAASTGKFGSGLYTDADLAGAVRAPLSGAATLDPAGDFTIDMWVRPAQLGVDVGIFSRDTNSGYSPYLIYQTSGNKIVYYSGTNESWNISSAQTICNSIALNTWYHVAVVRSGDTYSLYCNGTRTTTFTNSGKPWRAPFPLVIGRQYNGGGYFRGYIDEVRLSNTARWSGASFTVPTSEYSSDANTLLLMHMDADRTGHYSSSAGGYFAFTPPSGYKAVSTANLSAPAVTKPASYFDAKAYAGNAGIPSFDGATKGSYITLGNNNFDANSSTNCCWANGFVYSTNTFSSGKWYAEFKISGNYPVTIGIGDAAKRQSPEATLGYLPGEYSYYPYNGQIVNNNVFTGGYPGLAAGDTVMVAVDMDAGKIWFGKNGTWLGTGNPSTGANPQFSGISGSKAFAVDTLASAGWIYANFGQSGRFGTQYYGVAGGYFTYAPPTGFLALTSQATQDVNLVFKPDIVWVKNRTAAYAQTIVDSLRGANKNLFANSAEAQVAEDIRGSVLTLNSPGFTVGASCAATTGTGNVNASGNSYVAWVWDASPSSGLDIVTFNGTNARTQIIAHDLATEPNAIFVKRTDAPGSWFGWNAAFGGGTYLRLNANDGVSNASSPYGADLIPTMNAATTGGVTMSASIEYQPAWYAGDKSYGNRWQSYGSGSPNNGYPNSGYPQWLRVDLGSGVAKTVTAYTIATFNGGVSYNPTNFTLQGSNDSASCTSTGTTWTTLDTRTGITWVGRPDRKTFSVPVANQAAYRCYRVYVTLTNDNREVIISEINLWQGGGTNTSNVSFTNEAGADITAAPLGSDAIPTMTGATTGGVTMTASSQWSTSYVPWYAGDNNANNVWDSSAAPTTGSPQWLRVDFASSPKIIGAYAIQNYNSSNRTYDPVNFTFQGSNDASTCSASGTSWTTLDTRTGVTWVQAAESKTFAVATANQASYRCYRVNITQNNGSSNQVIIAELSLLPRASGTAQYVAYIFSDREGLQKSGMYYGNGSSEGPIIYTGFKPRFVMIKPADRSAAWRIYDTARDNNLIATNTLYPASASGESVESSGLQLLPNGFKPRWSDAAVNASQERYQYVAFAQAPFKSTYDGTSAYSVPSSLRLDSNVGAYLSRTLTATGNRKTHTFSAWIKRSVLGSEQTFFTGNTGSDDNTFLSYRFNSSGQIVITGWNTVWRQTYDSFNDTTNWYHVVVTIDTTQANADRRVRLWVNNQEITKFWCVDHICYSNP